MLLERYTGKMSYVTGDPRALDLKLLALVERLFDEAGVATAEKRLSRRGG